ncbi:hypothetical protein MKY34_08035 [Sporosarcina sp. FSL K6-1522]|uniref:hypothetical protein n=1 Tax=Sporosarcina sp. FSL K6-1522 TaxID=2921554 RepID=UPI003159AA54
MKDGDFILPDVFEGFIDSEIMDIETYYLIYNFVALDNFRQGEYEGNMYVIRKINANHIQLENEVATENTPKPKVYIYTKKEFLGLLQSHKPSL